MNNIYIFDKISDKIGTFVITIGNNNDSFWCARSDRYRESIVHTYYIIFSKKHTNSNFEIGLMFGMFYSVSVIIKYSTILDVKKLSVLKYI